MIEIGSAGTFARVAAAGADPNYQFTLMNTNALAENSCRFVSIRGYGPRITSFLGGSNGAGVIAKSVMHVHMTIFWTIVLGIIGSIIGGAVTHIFFRPSSERFHPAGLIFSTLGAILILYICYRFNIRFPHVQPR